MLTAASLVTACARPDLPPVVDGGEDVLAVMDAGDAGGADVRSAMDAGDASREDVGDAGDVRRLDVVDVPSGEVMDVPPGDVTDVGLRDVPVTTEVPVIRDAGTPGTVLRGAFVGGAASGSAGAVTLRGVFTWHAAVRATAGGITLEGWLR